MADLFHLQSYSVECIALLLARWGMNQARRKQTLHGSLCGANCSFSRSFLFPFSASLTHPVLHPLYTDPVYPFLFGHLDVIASFYIVFLFDFTTSYRIMRSETEIPPLKLFINQHSVGGFS